MRLFDEFDKDRNGHLSAAELAAALRSREVDISEELVQQFIEGASDAFEWPRVKSSRPGEHVSLVDQYAILDIGICDGVDPTRNDGLEG